MAAWENRGMVERFSESARLVVVFAEEEARSLGHPYVGTEHMLLGALRREKGVAARALRSLGVEVEELRREIAEAACHRKELPLGAYPLTPRAKAALELALKAAESARSNVVDTEDMLLGLLGVAGATAIRVLRAMGIHPEDVRAAIRATPHLPDGASDERSSASDSWTLYRPVDSTGYRLRYRRASESVVMCSVEPL
jgi:ATP-dependent Clp protease ATP-binding subunit ClpC